MSPDSNGNIGTDTFRLLRAVCIAGLALLCGTNSVIAQRSGDPFPGESQQMSGGLLEQLEEESVLNPNRRSSGRLPEGPGIQFRTGHLTGPGVGRQDSLTHFDLFPYVMFDDSMLFSDLRMFVTNRGQLGGNLGLGYRTYSAQWERLFGASVWYDADDSTRTLFHQVGVSLETYGNIWDLRSNIYVPVGNTNREIRRSVVAGSPRFLDNLILYDRAMTRGTAMTGLDMELGLPIPGRWLERFDPRIYAGWYHFQAGGAQDAWGWKGRVEASLPADIDLQLEVSNDRVFNTNVIFGVAWTFSGKWNADPPGRRTPRDRFLRRVQRNFHIVTQRTTTVDEGLTAINPETGNPYTVHHVDSNAAAGGDGSVLLPFQSIVDAQADYEQGGLIFVHADSEFIGHDALVTLQPGQTVLGEGNGINHTIRVEGMGNMLVPRATAGTNRPVFRDASGNSIVLASDSEFSGFVVTGAGDSGIFGDSITNAIVRQTLVEQSGAEGILLTNSSGNILFDRTEISDSFAAGLRVDGGDATVRFNDRIDNSDGYALLVENTTGGLVDLTGSTINDDGGAGIRIANSTGNVVVGTANLQNGSGHGVHLDGNSGTVTFQQSLTVTNSSDSGIFVDNQSAGGIANFNEIVVDNSGSSESAIEVRDSDGTVNFGTVAAESANGNPTVQLVDNPGSVNFGTLDITSDNATALFARNTGNLRIQSGGTIAATDGTAVDIEDTQTSIVLTSISSESAAHGLRLVNTEGTFFVLGDGTLGSGGLISDAGTGVLLENAGSVQFNYLDLGGNTVGIVSRDTELLELNGVRIGGSTGYGIDALNTESLVIANSLLNNNGTGGVENVRFRANEDGNYALAIAQTTINSSDGDGILVSSLAGAEGSNLNLIVHRNEINNFGAGQTGLKMEWDGPVMANISRNEFNGTANNYTAINLNALSATEMADLSVIGNGIFADGNNSTGLSITTAGPSTVAILGNEFEFDGNSSAGMRFSLAESADVEIDGNDLTFFGDGGTGMLFSSIEGPSLVKISGNLIQFQNTGALTDRGIVFSSVTSPPIVLSGSDDNIILNADTLFQAPVGTTAGQIKINGTSVPSP